MTTDASVRRNADPGSVAFVTGANRGIGLEVTRQLLARTKGERLTMSAQEPVVFNTWYLWKLVFSDSTQVFSTGPCTEDP